MFVTTIIPVYNAERYIEATLDSVGKQTRPPDRLIIQDNCSTDRTPELVGQFRAKYPHIRCEFLRNETNIGGLANFNRALKWGAETDVFHILSADDLIKPLFFERLLPLLAGVKDRALVHCELEFIDDEGKTLPTFPRAVPAGVEDLTQLQFLKRQAELRHVYCQSVLLYTGRKPIPITFRTDMLQANDVHFFSEWATYCERIRVLRDPLCLYRVHLNSTTGKNLSNLNAWVLEEWRAMEMTAGFFRTGAFDSWLHRQKRKCIFAARSKVKMQQVGSKDPGYADAIGAATRKTVGSVHWLLGVAAVKVRDLIHPVKQP